MPKNVGTKGIDQQDRLSAATAGLTANRGTFYYAMLLSLSGSVSDADWDKALKFAGHLWGPQASSTSDHEHTTSPGLSQDKQRLDVSPLPVPPSPAPTTSGLSKDKGAK